MTDGGSGWHMDPLVRVLLWLLVVLTVMFILAIALSLVQRVAAA
jgi:hypothetical protein